MDIYMPMSTTKRHNKIAGTFFGTVLDLLRKKEIDAMQEECALVYWGSRVKPEPVYLIDIDGIENLNDFKENTINDLEYVQPDFTLFHKNIYAENTRGTRTAGRPDLIVEVWSKDNSAAERKFKLDLYSGSPITEHWYIEQDKNEVICYLGNTKIKNQSLCDILVTREGLGFDLRYLAI